MPKLSPTMEEGQLSRWLKKEGDYVSIGEPLAEVDTDKATMEMAALVSGFLRIIVTEGETVPLGQVIAIISDRRVIINTPAEAQIDHSKQLGIRESTDKRIPRIFISYRRDNSEGQAGRLFDGLSLHFGKDKIFMDIDSIEPGEDFVEVIEREVGCCSVLIAIIGKEWLNSTDVAGRRRLDKPEDYVRLEIATALERNIRVIPVLVQGASMPYSQELPESLAKLARRQAIELSSARWQHDVSCLIQTLEKIIGLSKST